MKIGDRMKKLIKNKDFRLYGIIFITMLLLCYLFPYSHDDWAWGSSVGIERLHSFFANYNGRYLGNLVVLVLTRSNIIKTLSMASVLTAILYLINKIINSKYKIIENTTILLFLCMPYAIFKSAIVWTSGFSNYATSTLLVLLYIYLNKDFFKEEKENYNNWIKNVLMAILGFVSALFVEHVTIYLFLASMFFVIFRFIKNKKIDKRNLFYFVGILIGTVCMFSNEAYHSVSTGADAYRSIGFLSNLFNNYFTTIYKELVFNNLLVNIFLSVTTVILLLQKEKQNQNKNSKKLSYVLIFILTTFVAYMMLRTLLNVSIFLRYTKYFEGLFSILYLFALFVSFVLIFERKEIRYFTIFICFSIVFLTLPLFIVTPIGSRCFLTSYTLFILLVGMLLNILFEKQNIKDNEVVHFILTTIVCVVLFFWFGIYGYIFKVNKARENYIKNNLTKNEFILPKLPYQKYLWCGDPVNETFEMRFKLFNGIENKSVKFVTLKEWKKIK